MPSKTGVRVKLIGTDGNVFALIGTVTRALKRAGKTEEAAQFVQATKACGSYDEVLRLIMDWVEVH